MTTSRAFAALTGCGLVGRAARTHGGCGREAIIAAEALRAGDVRAAASGRDGVALVSAGLPNDEEMHVVGGAVVDAAPGSGGQRVQKLVFEEGRRVHAGAARHGAHQGTLTPALARSTYRSRSQCQNIVGNAQSPVPSRSLAVTAQWIWWQYAGLTARPQ